MKVAIVLTVKNEERILKNNVLYHRAIGAEKIFIYFDDSSDNGRETVSDLDYVELSNSVDPIKYTHLSYLNKFTSQADKHHTARQCLNTFDAQEKCKKEGIEWLISIDADELICTNMKAPSNLRLFFNEIPLDIDLVYFQTYEAVQRKKNYNNVFEEEVLFKNYSTAKKNSRFIKKMWNPFTNDYEKFSAWYGQTMGKGGFRVQKEVIPRNVHRYQKINQENLRQLKKGFVLHFHAYDSTDFIKKFINFQNHPNSFLSGNKVERIKLLMRDIVNNSGMKTEELKVYFETNLLFSEADIEKMSRDKFLFFNVKNNVFEEILSVRQVFQQIK